MNRIYKVPKGTEVYTGNNRYTKTDIDWYVNENDIAFGENKCMIFYPGIRFTTGGRFLLNCDTKDLEKYNHE